MAKKRATKKKLPNKAAKKAKSAAKKKNIMSTKARKQPLKKVRTATKVRRTAKVAKRRPTLSKAKPSRTRASTRKAPTVDMALHFLSTLPLPPRPEGTRSFEGPEAISFTTEQSQSMIVGSDIVSFAAGLPDTMRTVITNSLLLAQLAASKKIGDTEKTTEWYKMYFSVLTTLGWVIQEQGFTVHEEKGKDFEVHKAILAVATTVFSAGATALAIITSTLKALEKMGDGPWLTVFKKKSQRGKVAQFQVTVVEPIGDGGCKISLMAFELEGKNNLTQVLFFKFNSSGVTLKHASGTVTLDRQMMADLGPAIANKVRPFQLDFIANIQVE